MHLFLMIAQASPNGTGRNNMADIYDVLNNINDIVWFIPFILIVIIGLYSTLKFKGVQFTQIPEMIRVTFSGKGKKSHEASSFRIFCISMASRIGVGNISGPIVAILIGGPGAIFWMWIFAIIGSATGFVEAILGQLYKKKSHTGYYEGGPAHNFRYGLKWKKVAVITAILMALLNFIGFIAVQASATSLSLSNAFAFDGNKFVFAIILTAVVLFIIIGGFKRISNISAYLIPMMAVGWILICILAIISNGNIVGAFQMIFSNALSVPAALGGGVGAMLVIAMKRCILSNEAGLGKSTCVSASADVRHPVYQGYTQALGVFIDMIIFTCSALVVLSYTGFDPLQKTDMESLTILHHAFEPLLGSMAPIIVTIFVFVFALSTIYGDFFIGLVNVDFLTDKKKWIYASYALAAVVIFFAVLYSDDRIFIIADIFMAFVALMNCMCMFFLFDRVVDAYRDYTRQKKENVDVPEFHKSNMEVDSDGITEWD